MIAGYINELKEFMKLPNEKFIFDSGTLHITERLVQLIVDGMIDTNQHFIRELNFTIPDDLQSTFYSMGENNILPKAFAEKIAPVVGVRNILVHQYEKLDKELFVRNLKNHFGDLEDYARYIYGYVQKMK